jgi:hypothetical protein
VTRFIDFFRSGDACHDTLTHFRILIFRLAVTALSAFIDTHFSFG